MYTTSSGCQMLGAPHEMPGRVKARKSINNKSGMMNSYRSGNEDFATDSAFIIPLVSLKWLMLRAGSSPNFTPLLGWLYGLVASLQLPGCQQSVWNRRVAARKAAHSKRSPRE